MPRKIFDPEGVWREEREKRKSTLKQLLTDISRWFTAIKSITRI